MSPIPRSPAAALAPKRLAFLALALVLVACGDEPPPIEPDATSVRELDSGAVVGFAANGFDAHVWKGIPFARPPVGDLRWRAPQPPEPWTGTREAIESASPCVQFDVTDSDEIVGEEDCLFLDVYAPRFSPAALPADPVRLPVMVWIHGGGNTLGSAKVYDAARLASEGDVIVVVVQYRLGVLGWFAHPALRAGAADPAEASGNFGTLDLVRALEWVRRNAAAFGGDPRNVTLFGESAGGVNVFSLMLSPLAKGLFHRAISQSGLLVSNSFEQAEALVGEDPRSVGSREQLVRHLLRDRRATTREEAVQQLAAMEAKEIEAYLRGKSARELLDVFRGQVFGGMYFAPYLFRDGHVLPEVEPLEALADPALHNRVPIISGTNREETKLFALMTSPYVRRIFGFPIGFTDAEGFDLEGEYGGLLWKVQAVDEPLTALRSAGLHAVYGYRFDWDDEGSLLWLDMGRLLGAAHAIEILFVFGFTDFGRWTDNVFADRDAAEELSRQMRSYWTRFAYAGAPGRGRLGDLPEWRPWSARSPAVMSFDSEADGGVRMDRGTMTRERVAEKLASDVRVRSEAQRCEIFKGLVLWSGAYELAAYEEFADGACAKHPIDLAELAGEGG